MTKTVRVRAESSAYERVGACLLQLLQLLLLQLQLQRHWCHALLRTPRWTEGALADEQRAAGAG